MGGFGRVQESDWSALLRLAGEVSELAADVAVRRAYILDKLCDLLGARSGVIFEISNRSEEGVAVPGTLVTVRMPEQQREALRDYIAAPSSRTDGFNERAIPALLTHTVCPRRAFIDDRAWYRCSNYERTMRPWGVDDRIHSLLTLPGGVQASMSLVREKSDRPFSPKESEVLALFHTHVGSLYHVPPPAEVVAAESLPPRLRPVLMHLLEGDAEKQVAARLGLSRHTIHAYVKDLYRRFDVNSRGELLARFRRG